MSLANTPVITNDLDLNGLFEDTIADLKVEHSVVETDYKHEFDEKKITDGTAMKSSPYMIVKSDNDKILKD